MGVHICSVRSRYVVANPPRWSQPYLRCSFFIRRIVSPKQRIVALWQRQVGFGCVRSVSGRGGSSCGHGGFGSCEAVAEPAATPASATTAVTVAAIPFERVGLLPSNLVLDGSPPWGRRKHFRPRA